MEFKTGCDLVCGGHLISSQLSGNQELFSKNEFEKDAQTSAMAMAPSPKMEPKQPPSLAEAPKAILESRQLSKKEYFVNKK